MSSSFAMKNQGTPRGAENMCGVSCEKEVTPFSIRRA
jgi:hypothetical protein